MIIHHRDKGGKLRKFREIPSPSEERIEAAIESDPSILGEHLMIIGRQVPTEPGKFDLLALDKDGNVVIIEVKKKSKRGPICQVLDYGMWAEENISEKTIDKIVQKKYLNNYKNLEEKFMAWTGSPEPELKLNQRLFIVAEHIEDTTKRLAKYLGQKEIEISCFEYKTYGSEDGGEQIIIANPVIDARTIKKPRESYEKTEDEHLEKHNERIRNLYNSLRSAIKNLGRDVDLRPKNQYIGFWTKGKIFTAVRLRKDKLIIHLNIKEGFKDPRKITIQSRGHKNRKKFFLKDEKELSYLMNLIKQCYE